MAKSQNLTTFVCRLLCQMLVQFRCFLFVRVTIFSIVTNDFQNLKKSSLIIFADIFQQCKDGIMPEDIKAVLLQQAGFHPVM